MASFTLRETELFSVHELQEQTATNPKSKHERSRTSKVQSSADSASFSDLATTAGAVFAGGAAQLWQLDKAFFPSASNGADNAAEDENLSEASASIIRQIQQSKTKATNLPNDTIESFPEDWQMSQFWYSPESAVILAQAICKHAGSTGSVAVVSAPTLFCALKRLQVPNFSEMVLLEYDPRFRSFGSQFCQYDYNSPVKLPPRYKQAFTTVYVDPPFRSEECIEKSVETAKFLAKPDDQGQIDVMFCTGQRFESVMQHLLSARMSTYHPQHSSKLANPCRLYLTTGPEVST